MLTVARVEKPKNTTRRKECKVKFVVIKFDGKQYRVSTETPIKNFVAVFGNEVEIVEYI